MLFLRSGQLVANNISPSRPDTTPLTLSTAGRYKVSCFTFNSSSGSSLTVISPNNKITVINQSDVTYKTMDTIYVHYRTVEIEAQERATICTNQYNNYTTLSAVYINV